MNITNSDLTNELFSLSNWVDPTTVGGYDLGFLLRKLPENLARKEDDFVQAWLSMDCLGSDGWQFSYRKGASKPDIKATAETPEDAAAKLCIELFKNSILGERHV